MNNVIGQYRYLGGEDTSDLSIGKVYNRIEPEDEFRIVDDSGESFLYLPENFNIYLSDKIDIVQDNIVNMNVDAIICASNNNLLRGSGLCGAIYKKAGFELDEECAKIGHCVTGSAVITNGYNLNAKYIIHTVAPRWYMIKPEEEKRVQLRNCYKNIFKVAIENNIKTIAIPCIGTGIYQCPIDVGKEFAFEEANKVADKFDKIYFVCFRDEEYEIYTKKKMCDRNLMLGLTSRYKLLNENAEHIDTPFGKIFVKINDVKSNFELRVNQSKLTEDYIDVYSIGIDVSNLKIGDKIKVGTESDIGMEFYDSDEWTSMATAKNNEYILAMIAHDEDVDWRDGKVEFMGTNTYPHAIGGDEKNGYIYHIVDDPKKTEYITSDFVNYEYIYVLVTWVRINEKYDYEDEISIQLL